MLSNSSALPFLPVSRYCGYCSFSHLLLSRSSVILIYKLAAKPWPTTHFPSSSINRRRSGRDIAAANEKEESMISWGTICQPKQFYTQNLNASKQSAVISLPMPQSREEVGVFFFPFPVRGRVRPEGGEIRSKLNWAPREF